MNSSSNLQKKITLYIIIFFIILLLGVLGVFSYIFFDASGDIKIHPQPSIPTIPEVSREVEIDPPTEEPVENPLAPINEYVALPCKVSDNTTIDSGQKILLYSNLTVGIYEQCSDFSRYIYCDNSFLIGDKRYIYETCSESIDCQINANLRIKNGEKIKLFVKKKVPFGQSCSTYQSERTCANGSLKGEKQYIYTKCEEDLSGICKLESGEKIPNKKILTLYSKKIVSYDDSCNNYKQPRTCTEGYFSGDDTFKYKNCSKSLPFSCSLDNSTVPHNKSKIFYSKRSPVSGKPCRFFSKIRTCSDGQLSGIEEYKYSNCN